MSNVQELVEVCYGSQTFSTTSAKVAIFCLLPGNKAKSFPDKVMTQARKSSFPASTDGHRLHGFWTTAIYHHVEGMMLMVQVLNSVRGAQRNNASMLLSLRETGPTLMVQANISPHRDAALSKVTAFIGKADIMSPAEAMELGYVLDRNYIDTFFHQDEIEEVFDIQELSPATTDKPEIMEVSEPTGEKRKVLVSPKRKRRIVIRKSK